MRRSKPLLGEKWGNGRADRGRVTTAQALPSMSPQSLIRLVRIGASLRVKSSCYARLASMTYSNGEMPRRVPMKNMEYLVRK